MRGALQQYKENTRRARDLVGLASTLTAQTTQALDVSDIFRAALLLAVSALDHFVHEVSRKGMLEVVGGLRPATDAYYRFSVSLRTVSISQSQSGGAQWLDDEIRKKHGWLSFQDPDKIADAIRLISPKDLWHEVGIILRSPAGDVKSRLRLLVDRRNKVAHEADMDPSFPGARWPIDSVLVLDAIDFLDGMADALLGVVA